MTDTPDDRTEHLAYCKARALAYVDTGDLVGAMASFASDMNKHPATRDYINTPAIAMLFAMEAVAGVNNNDPALVRRFIEGCR